MAQTETPPPAGDYAPDAPPPMPAPVAAAFARFPEAQRPRLEAARALIFSVAAGTEGVGPLTETLKWGEPAYLDETRRAGTTLRLGLSRGSAALLVHCRTTLMDDLRARFPGVETHGERAAPLPDGPPGAAHAALIRMALEYRRKR